MRTHDQGQHLIGAELLCNMLPICAGACVCVEYMVVQDLDEKTSTAADHIKGLKQKDGKFLGLLIKEEHAVQFIRESEDLRKVYEVRNRPIRFLAGGDRLAILSCQAGRPRQVLAVVEFHGNVKIMDSAFAKHFPLHRVETVEYEKMKSKWSKHPGFCWAWHFELVYTFAPGVHLMNGSKGCEVWMYFSPEDVRYPEASLSPSFRSKSSSSCETTIQAPKRKDFGASSTDLEFSITPLQKRQKLGVEDLEDPQDGASETAGEVAQVDEQPESVECIILQDFEWTALMRGEAMLLRPFQSHLEHLVALVRRKHGFAAVGALTIKECTQLDDDKLMAEGKQVYPQSQLRLMKSNKATWLWSFSGVDTYDEESPISWTPTSFRNRTFSLPFSSLCHGKMLDVPQDLDLCETGAFFLSRCTVEQQHAILSQLKRLSGKPIRVASTCSGSDICITVLKKTLSALRPLLQA